MKEGEFEKSNNLEVESGLSEIYRAIMPWSEYARQHHAIPYPYLVEGEDKSLYFFGANHSHDPKNEQYPMLKDALESFTPDIIYFEGRPSLNDPAKQQEELNDMRRVASGMSIEEAIVAGAESGFAVKYAFDRGIELKSPEPNTKEEYQNLIEKGFSREHIFAKYQYMIIPQWHGVRLASDKEGIGYQSLREYVEPRLKRFQEATQWDGFDYSWDHLTMIGQELWGDPEINQTDPDHYVPLIDPTPWPGTEQYQSPINEIAREGSLLRDRYLIREIARDLQTHSRPFVVFGASHAVMIRPALEKMFRYN